MVVSLLRNSKRGQAIKDYLLLEKADVNSIAGNSIRIESQNIRQTFAPLKPAYQLLEYRKGHDQVAMRITTVTSLPSPSPLLLLLAQLLVRLILPGQQAAGAASTCPAPCSCSNQASRVICTRRNLDEVPDNISNNTRYLNLQENSIQVNTHYDQHFPSCIVSASCATALTRLFLD